MAGLEGAGMGVGEHVGGTRGMAGLGRGSQGSWGCSLAGQALCHLLKRTVTRVLLVLM